VRAAQKFGKVTAIVGATSDHGDPGPDATGWHFSLEVLAAAIFRAAALNAAAAATATGSAPSSPITAMPSSQLPWLKPEAGLARLQHHFENLTFR
jgi:hypothetical protein